MNITDEEIKLLEASKSESDWNSACDKIKEARNGHYPPDWWPKIKMSGMMDRILNSFGADSDIHIISI